MDAEELKKYLREEDYKVAHSYDSTTAGLYLLMLALFRKAFGNAFKQWLP